MNLLELFHSFSLSGKASPTLGVLTVIYTNGLARDKLWKLVQNVSRCLFYLITLNTTQSSSLRRVSEWFKNLWKNVSTARKGFRVGKSIVHANKLRTVLLDKRRTDVYKCISSIQRSALFAHEIFDNCVWFSSSKLIATHYREYCKQWAYTTKFLGETLGMYLQYMEWCRINSRRGDSSGSSGSSDGSTGTQDGSIGDKAKQKQRAKIIRSVTKGFAQVLAAGINAKYGMRFFGWKKNDGVLGLCGIVNAVISLYDYWPGANQANASKPLKRKS